MRWNRVLTWDTAPFTIPVPFGNLGDGVEGKADRSRLKELSGRR